MRARSPSAVGEPADIAKARRRAFAALSLVVFSFVSLAIFPPMLIQRAQRLRDNFLVIQEPAHVLLAQVQRGCRMQSTALRDYVISGDERARADYSSARSVADFSAQRLHVVAAVYTGPLMSAGADSLLSRLRASYAPVDSLFAGQISRSDYRDHFDERQQGLEHAYAETQKLAATLARDQKIAQAELTLAEARARLTSFFLIGLALVSALLVANLAREYWQLAARVSKWANERLNVIRIAGRLNQAVTPEDLQHVLSQEEESINRLRSMEKTDSGEVDEIAAKLLPGVIQEASKRVSLGAELRESLRQFQQIADGLNVGVWLRTVHKKRFLFMNSALEKILEIPSEKLYADPEAFLSAVHPDDVDRVKEVRKKNLFEIEYRVVHHDGRTRWVWTRAFPVHNENGEMFRVAGITEDITEMKLVAESRTRLIRGFTHDVKNPLGAADGQLALLDQGVRGELDEYQKEGIARARKAIQSALELTNDLLDIARAEAGKLQVNRVPVDIGAMVRQVTEEFRATAQSAGLALSVEIEEADAGRPLIALTDKDRVRQILANFVSNAIKYTPRGGKVCVSTKRRIGGDAPREGEWIAIAVQDTGVGISSEQQPLLFKEFARFNAGVAEGAGIGLAISERLAQALHAEITVRSKPHVGSTFTLWLPWDQPDTSV